MSRFALHNAVNDRLALHNKAEVASTLYIVGIWVSMVGVSLVPYEPANGGIQAALGFILALVGAIKST